VDARTRSLLEDLDQSAIVASLTVRPRLQQLKPWRILEIYNAVCVSAAWAKLARTLAILLASRSMEV
jgi:hypothetical protein